MNWSVRLLEMKDVHILLDWYNNEELHYIANAKKFKAYTLENLTDYWKEKLSRVHSTYYVILWDKKVVGRVGLKKKENQVEYSILIGDSNLFSKGIGSQVTAYFVTEVFKEPDVLSVNLSVRADNLRAIRCYEKVGFKVTNAFFENDIKLYEMRIHKEQISALI